MMYVFKEEHPQVVLKGQEITLPPLIRVLMSSVDPESSDEATEFESYNMCIFETRDPLKADAAANIARNILYNGDAAVTMR